MNIRKIDLQNKKTKNECVTSLEISQNLVNDN